MKSAILTPEKVVDRLNMNFCGIVGTHKDFAAWAELIVLAANGSAAEIAIRICGAADPVDKTIIDTTNPIADAPPDNGVLRYFTAMDESLMEQLQKANPKAHFVKAFNSVGNAYMVDPDFGGIKPTMFIYGNEATANRRCANSWTSSAGRPRTWAVWKAPVRSSPMHTLVHPRLRTQPMDPRVQTAEEITGCGPSNLTYTSGVTLASCRGTA